MTYVRNATAVIPDMIHYIKKIKEHEANRTSTNDRNTYWKSYFDVATNTPDQSSGKS